GGPGDAGHARAHKSSHEPRQAIEFAPQPMVLHRYVLALDVTGFVEALAERGGKGRIRRSGIDECDYRHLRLLRSRRKRPRRRCAPEQPDEIAPSDHSITSSARVRSMGGTARPMAFAAFKLITSSSCVGNSIGSSAGVAPLEILSMYTATRRAFARRLMP